VINMATTATKTKTRTAAARDARARKVGRVLAIIGAAPVAVVAAYVSYFHITDLASRHGQSQSAAHLLPVAIDGLMLVAAVAVVAQRTARLPRAAFFVGAALTLGANILSVHDHGDPVAYVVAAVPAGALLLAAEMLLRLTLPATTKRRRPTTRKAATAKRTAPARTKSTPAPAFRPAEGFSA
jgi:peptidoglycan/LPS O-acetylase OafA/YrhL